MKKKTDRQDSVTLSSGNVFADLGLPDAEELMTKANLALHIRSAIKARKLTQKQAAETLGIDQPKVSAIINGRLEGYSVERLTRFLDALGTRVKMTVTGVAAEPVRPSPAYGSHQPTYTLERHLARVHVCVSAYFNSEYGEVAKRTREGMVRKASDYTGSQTAAWGPARQAALDTGVSIRGNDETCATA